MIGKNRSLEKMNSLVFASDKWHPGVIGIVASRLVELFNRPAFVISIINGVGKGSGRSISGFNIYKGIQQCEHLLLSFGGHYHAAGISIEEANIEKFSAVLDELTGDIAEFSEIASQITIDTECGLEDIDPALLAQMEALAPFGSRNPEPLLLAHNVKASSLVVVGNNHLKMSINSNGTSRDSIWFNMGKHLSALDGASLDIVFTPQINNWNGSADIQLKIKDVNIVS
jgi:single-stranded-DNA-specific exonuclease